MLVKTNHSYSCGPLFLSGHLALRWIHLWSKTFLLEFENKRVLPGSWPSWLGLEPHSGGIRRVSCDLSLFYSLASLETAFPLFPDAPGLKPENNTDQSVYSLTVGKMAFPWLGSFPGVDLCHCFKDFAQHEWHLPRKNPESMTSWLPWSYKEAIWPRFSNQTHSPEILT